MWSPNSKCRFLLALSALLPLPLGLAGCDSGKALGPVSGTVTFQGRPVTEGIVGFSNPQRAIHLTAKLDGQGHYEVKTHDGAGLPPGTYQVTVGPPMIDPPIGPARGPINMPVFPNIPEKYRRPETSGLILTVSEETNRFDIDMQP